MTLSASWPRVTGRIRLDLLSGREIVLFRLLTVGRGFLVAVEVCSNQLFEEYAEAAGPAIIDLVDLLPYQLFCLGR